MKFIRILQKHKDASEEQIKDFIYKNMSEEMLRGLEHDDPRVIKRALKLFGVDDLKYGSGKGSGSTGEKES